MAFQMIAILLMGVFGGIKLDEYFTMNFPLFTVILSLFAVFAALYTGLKDFIRKK